ncbi:hypothetical protein [Rhodococcus jostii]|uniref:hypothetical protein n=1 Tax=Rhodococcus jostii TaxID=132919 RepID=UPI003630377D
MPFADLTDLQARWSALPSADEAVATQLLADASLWLRAWFPTAETAAVDSEDLSAALTMVCCSIVKRAMLNADREGLTSYGETIDAYAEQVVFRNPDGNLYVTNAERGLLETLLGLNTSGAVSLTAWGL